MHSATHSTVGPENIVEGLELVTAPLVEPIKLQEAKDYVRQDDSTDDELIVQCIKAARKFCERQTQKTFITQTWNMFIDNFPRNNEIPRREPWWDGTREGPISLLNRGTDFIEIPKGPLISVTEVVTVDEADVELTFDASNYLVDNKRDFGRIYLKKSSVWPFVDRPVNGIRIKFISGYGPAGTDIPEDLHKAILYVVAHFYENRCPLVESRFGLSQLPMTVQDLLTTYKQMRIGGR